MTIRVNNKELSIAEASSIEKLATVLELPVQGVAIAVNNRMIPRADWSTTLLNENDQVVVIKAACGG